MEYVKIGAVVNTHGLNGVLKVKSFTDFKKERYRKNNVLYILFKHEYIPVTVNWYKEVKNIDHVKFQEFDHINDCEKYRGCELFISSDEIHELDEDEFYFDELIDMEVHTNNLIGICIDVREVPQGEMLVVRRENKKDLLIPFNKQFIKEVNKKDNRIFLIEWEGLL